MITTQVLGYVCGGLLLANAGQALYAYKLKADVATAEAAVATVTGERDAAKKTATDNFNASEGWKKIANERRDLLIACQNENTRMREENDQAIEDADAKRKDAERALKTFIEKYAADVRTPDCAAARRELDAKCPVISY